MKNAWDNYRAPKTSSDENYNNEEFREHRINPTNTGIIGAASISGDIVTLDQEPENRQNEKLAIAREEMEKGYFDKPSNYGDINKIEKKTDAWYTNDKRSNASDNMKTMPIPKKKRNFREMLRRVRKKF